MWLIALKEIRELLYNPKFLLTFAVSTVLILISIFNGYAAYDSERRGADIARVTAMGDIRDLASYNSVKSTGYRVSRYPEKMSIFNVGISGVVGRKCRVRGYEALRPRESRYSLNPIFAVFGELDLTFSVGIILSLFAILFSYNAVSGEREAGTLRLMMSNSIGRASVLAGKLFGCFLPLALLFVLPFLLGLAYLLFLTEISFSGGEWLSIGVLALACLLYLLVFTSIGLAMSALTRNSFVSFLLCLFIWVLSVTIISKVAVQTAAQASPPMQIDEVESRIQAYDRDSWSEYSRRLVQYVRDNPISSSELENGRFREAQKIIYDQINEEDQAFQEELFNEYWRKRNQMLHTAMALSRVSPSSCLSFIVNGLSGTGPEMLDRFEQDLAMYRGALIDYLDEKQARLEEREGERMRGTGLRYSHSEDGYIQLELLEGEEGGELNLSGMPRFRSSFTPLAEATGDLLPDYAVLALYAIGFFAAAFVAFLRYDVR